MAQNLPATVHTLSQYAAGFSEFRALAAGANPTSGSWPSANLAIYVPMVIPFTFTTALAFWANGSAGGGNVDFGIYDASTLAKVASLGSTAQSGTSNIQTAAFVTTLSPGRYYFALSCSATTNAISFNGSVTAVLGRQMGVLQEASAVPLPATATPVTFASVGYPLIGVTR